MSDGTFCRICHRLMVPIMEQICCECQDAMKRAGYEKVVHCDECKHGTKRLDAARNDCIECHRTTCWHCYPLNWHCAGGERKETE